MRRSIILTIASAMLLAGLVGCAVESSLGSSVSYYSGSTAPVEPSSSQDSAPVQSSEASSKASSKAASSASAESSKALAEEIFKKLGVQEDYRDVFVHGDKPAKYQKYIVLHETEGGGSPTDVINSWENAERGIAAHFVIGRDGSVVQCVKLDKIAHHAGFGDTGHNEEYGVEDESRDDKELIEPIGDWASDYGMNSYSIGIELVHIGGEEDYPEVQLQALDAVIAYIDAYYAGNSKKSKIIDHKAWRSGNSDTSEEFIGFFESYKGKYRTHDDKAWDISLLDGWEPKESAATEGAQDEGVIEEVVEEDVVEEGGVAEDDVEGEVYEDMDAEFIEDEQ